MTNETPKPSIRLLLKNLRYWMTEDAQNALDFKQSAKEARAIHKQFQDEALNHAILVHGNLLPAEFSEEVNCLKQIGRLQVFPYPQRKVLDIIRSGMDESRGLPFVWHGDKRLYFPQDWTVQQAELTYRIYVEVENLLGGGYMEKTPHQYQTDAFCVKEGDVVLDVGAAEGLFALSVIEKARRVYLFESDACWTKPLLATFEPYQDKVVLVNKLISDKDSGVSVRLDTMMKNESFEGLFIKMDIEGHEATVVNASRVFLSQNKDIRVVCCVYHRHDDAEELKGIFNALSYQAEFSSGFMLYYFDHLKFPYFRHGVIRATRQGVGMAPAG